MISPTCLCLSEVSSSPAVATACCVASAIRVSVFSFRRADTIHEEEGVRYVLVGGEAADGYHRVRTWFPSTLTISKGYEKITFILGGYGGRRHPSPCKKIPPAYKQTGSFQNRYFFKKYTMTPARKITAPHTRKNQATASTIARNAMIPTM